MWLITVYTAVAVAAVLSLGAAGVYALSSDSSKKTAEPETEMASTETVSSGNVIWNGREYKYNSHLSNYLILGVDTREKVETSAGMTDAGQADAIYLVSYDRVENTVRLITIPRDTMTEIEVFSMSGNSMGMGENHISLSYAYGDGGHESCRLTEEAVSKLLYGVPIQSYCAISMDGMPALTESVSGVEVTVPNDSLEEAYPEFAEGAQVKLDAENTEIFVRYRDTEISQSALARMERQQEYIRAFGEAARQRMAEDAGYAAELYMDLEPYMVTTMGKDEFVKLAQSLMTGEKEEGWTVPGEGVEGVYHDEYHVDDNALYEKIIETFYVEAE